MLSLSLGGCRLHFKFSCFALLAFCCLFAGFPSGASFCLAAAFHEGAHLAVLFCLGAPPRSAEFSALGCRMVLDPEKRLSYRRNALVSLAGPAANLLSFGLLALLGKGSLPFAQASLALGAFHSLPVEPLDGGLAFRALLSGFLEEKTTGRVSFCLSLALLLPLAVLGFLVLLRTRYNFSLLALSLYLMLYLLLKRDYLED